MKSALICVCLILASCSEKVAAPPKAHRVTALPAIACQLPVFLEYVGHVEANISVDVKAQVSGILIEQSFVEGALVKEGDLLLVIDPKPFQAALDKAEAQLARSYATLSYAEDKTKRYEPLLKEDFVSELNYEEFTTSALTSAADVEQMEADLTNAQINLGYCFIHAPMDCLTGNLRVKPGNYVDAAVDAVLTTLNQIQPVLVNFYVPETDLARIQGAQNQQTLAVEVFTDPSHTKSFSGILSLIDNQVNAQTGAILMQGTLPNEEQLLWPGHFVDVRLMIEEKKETIVVPSSAIQIGQSGHFIYVIDPDNTVSIRPVTIGQRYGDNTSIISGLAADEQVVCSGQLNLSSGMSVTVVEENTP